jgi:hypothetical protein
MATLDPNNDTTEGFAERMVGAIDNASLAILLSIGHQTKLFDTLAELPPATSTQVAEAAGLNERYVREWLGGVAAGRIVDYDPAAQTYSLPRHRAAVLTRAAGPDNLSRVAQFIALLAEVEQKVIGCFSTGGGLSYSEYPRFHKLMAETSGETFDAALVDVILPMAEGLPGAASRRRRSSRHWLWQRPCHQRDGKGVPRQSVHRHRLLRRGPRRGQVRGVAVGTDKRDIRREGCGHAGRHRNP